MSEAGGAARRQRGWCAVVVGCVLVGYVQQAVASPAITVSSARFGKVFVTGELPGLSGTVTAEPDAALRGRLLVQMVDGYRRPAGRASVAINVGPGETATRDVAIRSGRLGHFTVVATLRGAGGQTVARVETTAGIVPPLDE